MTNKAHLNVFGFPVFFRVSAMIAAVVAVLFLREIGLIIAGVLAVSILVHELGHSFAFRRYGTESHIVIHLFGGYSSPDSPHKLSHSEWVTTALAGPVVASLVLGLPAWLLREFTDLRYGLVGVVLQVLIYFNIYWGAVNLLPIWPLDGGRVLYHSTGGNWQVTKIATLVMSVPAAIIAIQLGYRFAAMFVAFNAYQVMTGNGPAGSGLSGNSRISGAAKAAKAYAAKPTKTRGAAGGEALELVYRELLRGRPDRASEPLDALRTSKHRRQAETAALWGELLASANAATSSETTTSDSALLAAVSANDLAGTVVALQEPTTIEAAAALRVLYRRGLLDQVCARLREDEIGQQRLSELERFTLDLGMVDEQIRVTAALSVEGHAD